MPAGREFVFNGASSKQPATRSRMSRPSARNQKSNSLNLTPKIHPAMKSKKNTSSAAAKAALVALLATSATFLIAAEPSSPTSRSASTPRNSSGVYSSETPAPRTNANDETNKHYVGESTAVSTTGARDIGTIEIKGDSKERATTTVLNANEIKEDQVVIPLKRESVNVTKRTVADGSVRLRKVVYTETVQQPVELRREMLVIQRVPEGSQQVTANVPGDFQEGDILLPMTREEVVITKRVDTDHVLAKVSIDSSKRDVSETVRREDIQVVDRGNTESVRVIGDISKVSSPKTDVKGSQVAFAPVR